MWHSSTPLNATVGEKKSGSIKSSLEVAYILAEWGQTPATIATGLLHDTVDDTHALEEIEEQFGWKSAI